MSHLPNFLVNDLSNLKVTLLILFLTCSVGDSDRQRDQLVVWNVGQGSWATLLQQSQCRHFDLGGEFAPIEKIRSLCADKNNVVFFSHWDLDHISFASTAKRALKNLCIEKMPGGYGSWRKRKKLKKIGRCKTNSAQVIEVEMKTARSTLKKLRSANSQSRIFIDSGVLFTGDSTVEAENLWANSIPDLKIRWLIVGHHGSKTSTSDELLSRLAYLKNAVISARKNRFGHPHSVVLKRLKDKKIPTLLTEEWGNIRFFLN